MAMWHLMISILVVSTSGLLLLAPTTAEADDAHAAHPEMSAAKDVKPLPLPADANASCSNAVFNEFSFLYRTCSFSIEHHKNPDELCCRGLSEYFGMNSSRVSRNCFCVPEVMARMTAREQYHRIHFSTLFQYCGVKYSHVVPFYQDGNGYCNGTRDDPVDITDVDEEYISNSPNPEISSWSSRLRKDWLMLTSFITSIISVPGFFLFMWPFVYDFIMMLMETSPSVSERAKLAM